jgi:hypothetical protein
MFPNMRHCEVYPILDALTEVSHITSLATIPVITANDFTLP